MTNGRPAPPEPIKRQLRQEAGFGCCECGHPFIQYHHIIPYAEEAHFRPEDMKVLCPTHHYLCTTGALSDADQRRLKARPRNVLDNEARGQLYVNSGSLRVELAGGVATNVTNLLMYGHIQVLRSRLADDGRVKLSAVIQNAEGVVAAEIIDNEWTLLPQAVWDFEVAPQRATVRSAAREISFEADCRNDRVRLRGSWHLGGLPLTFSPQGIMIGQHRLVRQMNMTGGGVFVWIT